MDKRFVIILVALAVVFGGVFWFNSAHNKKANTTTSAPPSNHTEGNANSSVTLVEYGDYQCPFCEEYYPIVKQVQQQFADKILFQFRNFPLVQLHPNAMAAARAAEAASLQGKFWQMHDALYDNQNSWADANNPVPFFQQYAQQMGLNMTQFNQDMNSQGVLNTINADIAAGTALGVDATPTFVLNGKVINTNDQPRSVADFAKLINTALAQKNK